MCRVSGWFGVCQVQEPEEVLATQLPRPDSNPSLKTGVISACPCFGTVSPSLFGCGASREHAAAARTESAASVTARARKGRADGRIGAIRISFSFRIHLHLLRPP